MHEPGSIQETLPPLPVAVWARILELVVEESLSPIHELVRLQLVCRTVLEAVRSVPLAVEVDRPDQLTSLRPLLLVCPCERVHFHRRVEGEPLLRDDAFRACSERSLKHLRAVVACTDTLASFPVLESLTLEAGAIHRFYPSVLGGLCCLAHLSLVRFPVMELSGLTPNVVETLKEIHVTPRPEALRCFFHMAFPRDLRLDRFHLHGSFADITGPRSAPVVTCDVRSLATQVRSCRIEAQSLRIALPSWRQDRPPRGADLLRALTGPGAIWEELEFRVLDNRVWLEPRESEAAASSSFDDLGELIPPPAVGLEPEDFLVDAACTHDILATLSWDHAGICRFPVIRLLRFPRREQGAGRDGGDDADED
ncbi:hypothetical protein QBZ16_001708 [Prototheca wickerhamii]|uniref:F-box domain-containing protein n=1 Tax=Prototheca wickerhamii TaxID=3111 RepID=A0AAD9MIT3_PROWI|nr:hypothetical protein QBZ16_001708 [Prototheca wickerhamii]